jgi:excisionase family DNA binding protein
MQPSEAVSKTMDNRETLVSGGLLTVREAEAFIGLKRSMLYKLMDRGELAYVKIGAARRIPKAALIKLAAENLKVGRLA